MNIVCGKVYLREWRTSDFTTELVWAQDKELEALDPTVGTVSNIQKLSICTLDGKLIGICALYDLTLISVQMGIRIGDREYWSKGYGTDAVNALVAYCFTTRDVEYIWLKVLPSNIRAIRCYEKCRFVQIGRLALGGYEFIVMERYRIDGE